MLSFRCGAATIAVPEREVKSMMWIDIGVTVLMTLRLVLFRPALPQLVDPNNDAWLLEEKDEQQECLLAVIGE
jgi:hypothetical protein